MPPERLATARPCQQPSSVAEPYPNGSTGPTPLPLRYFAAVWSDVPPHDGDPTPNPRTACCNAESCGLGPTL